MNKLIQLLNLKKECENCRKCKIGGVKIDGEDLSNVLSNMCLKAKIIVVGQNPGREEIKLRKPFIGMSGNFFDKAIKYVLGLDRSYFYITNTVKCFTPNNRPPTEEETKNCMHFLKREVGIIKPQTIITLGNPALRYFTGKQGITKLHGQFIRSENFDMDIFPLMHPSPLNMNSESNRKMFYEDLEKIKNEVVVN